MDKYAITSQQNLETISRHCPEALSTYIHCLNRLDENNHVFLSKKNIDIDLSENYRTFRNNIKKLARENLLEWHPLDDGISITFCEINY